MPDIPRDAVFAEGFDSFTRVLKTALIKLY